MAISARSGDVAEAWGRRYNGPANGYDSASGIAVHGSGNVVVTGVSYNANNNDIYTAKSAASDGALIWEKRYNGPGNGDDFAISVVVDGSGNVVVAGNSNDATNYNTGRYYNYYTAKYAAANGTLLWEKRYYGPVNDDCARAVAVDGSGNVVVTGDSFAINYFSDYYTAKYAATDGALLWEKRYNGPANSSDSARAIAVDASGNVVVTGLSYNANDAPEPADYYTAKYAAANGALLWERRYNGPAHRSDAAMAVVVDGGGNVVVTGNSTSGNNNSDIYTAKYASADGALIWEKRYNGQGNGNDFGYRVAVDGSSNVVVRGSSYNGTNNDMYTAKYAAADGALIWEKRYNGPANGHDYGSGIAVDGSGNVVVTGGSYNATNGDIYTAKYAAADGALIWEKRYNGQGNGDDFANAVAVDTTGNVVVAGGDYNGTNVDFYTVKYVSSCCGNNTYTGQVVAAIAGQDAYGWSAKLDNSSRDGLVLRDLSLSTRYVAEAISVPYFTILTARMLHAGITTAQRGELRANDAVGTPMRSRLVDFSMTNDGSRFAVQSTYRIEEIPGSPGSSLCIFQRYEFLNKNASQPLEPSGRLDAQVVKPIVSYCFTGAAGDTISDLRIAQRQAFWLDQAAHNSTAVFRDVPHYEPPFYLSFVTALLANPLPSEIYGRGILQGSMADWSNIHISFVDSIQEPIIDPEARYLPHAASEALHMHWRWPKIPEFLAPNWHTGDKPIIPAGSDQDLNFAVVRYQPGEDHPQSYYDLVIPFYPESLTSGRQVVWLDATGHQNQDEFFGFGFGLEDHVHFLSGNVTADAFLHKKDYEVSWFSGTIRATLGVANDSRFNLMKGPIYVVLNMPDGVFIDTTPPATTPTGTTSGGAPYFRLDGLGRDRVLHPRSSNLSSHGEETTDEIQVQFFVPSGVLNQSALDQKAYGLWSGYQVFAETPPQ